MNQAQTLTSTGTVLAPTRNTTKTNWWMRYDIAAQLCSGITYRRQCSNKREWELKLFG